MVRSICAMRCWRNPDQFVQTLTTKLMIYAMGRPMEWHDMPTIRGIVQRRGEG